MRISTTLMTLALTAGMTTMTTTAMAGDGTKASPYTPAELNAQKEALAASGDTVWVKADLKGLGTDGLATSNATAEDGTKNLAALFEGDGETFTAYSWAILGELAMEDLTNTKDLLMALTYGNTVHYYNSDSGYASYGNQYADSYEPETEHFSLVELEGALSIKIENGLRGYHIPSSYIIPQKVIAVKVSAGYSASKGAYVNYSTFDSDTATFVTPKNTGLVLMANDGTYDVTLTTRLHNQLFASSNALNPGSQAGLNAGTTKNRARLRFVADGTKAGFQRNSDENCTVTLESKDEVFLQVSSLANNFWGNYAWETEAKDWITWAGGHYTDYHATEEPADICLFDFQNKNMDLAIGQAGSDESLHAGDMTGKSVKQGDVTLTVSDPEGAKTASRYFYVLSKGNTLTLFKNAAITLQADPDRAIKAVSIVFQTSQNGLEATSGTYEAGNWTGNASDLTLTAPATRYIYSISVTTDKADENTVGIQAATPTAATMPRGIYDLTGRRVTNPTKGLYIIDGRKVMLK